MIVGALSLYDAATQAIGLAASACVLFGLAHKSDGRLFLVLIAAHALFCLHFWMLGALAGAGANAIAIFRAWFARNRRDRRTCLLLMIAFLAMAAFTVRAPIDLLAAFAPVVSTAVMFALTGWRMRLALLAASSMWLTYNLAQGSWGGVLNEVCVLLVSLVTIARLLRAETALPGPADPTDPAKPPIPRPDPTR